MHATLCNDVAGTGSVVRSYKLLHMMCQFLDTKPRTLTVFVSGMPKLLPRTLTYFSSMMDSTNLLHFFIPGLNRLTVF